MALLLFLGATWLPRLADCGGTPSPSPTPYQSLPPAPNYSAGVFLSPNTATTQIYTEGSSINVTWETSYKAVNLYFGFNPGYGDPITITSGQAQTWATYTLQCIENNCSAPYSFRAVDAYGTAQDQSDGGIWTGQFWIQPISSASSSTVTSTATSIATSTASTALSTSSSSSSALTTPASTTTPSPSSLVMTAPMTTITSSVDSSETSGSSSDSIAIEVGAGVGGGIVLLFIIGAVCFWKYRQKGSKKPSPQVQYPQAQYSQAQPYWLVPEEKRFQEWLTATHNRRIHWDRNPPYYSEASGAKTPTELSS